MLSFLNLYKFITKIKTSGDFLLCNPIPPPLVTCHTPHKKTTQPGSKISFIIIYVAVTPFAKMIKIIFCNYERRRMWPETA